ncbi:MAG: hypothetical protein V1824_02070, partial [archaeon]
FIIIKVNLRPNREKTIFKRKQIIKPFAILKIEKTIEKEKVKAITEYTRKNLIEIYDTQLKTKFRYKNEKKYFEDNIKIDLGTAEENIKKYIEDFKERLVQFKTKLQNIQLKHGVHERIPKFMEDILLEQLSINCFKELGKLYQKYEDKSSFYFLDIDGLEKYYSINNINNRYIKNNEDYISLRKILHEKYRINLPEKLPYIDNIKIDQIKKFNTPKKEKTSLINKIINKIKTNISKEMQAKRSYKNYKNNLNIMYDVVESRRYKSEQLKNNALLKATDILTTTQNNVINLLKLQTEIEAELTNPLKKEHYTPAVFRLVSSTRSQLETYIYCICAEEIMGAREELQIKNKSKYYSFEKEGMDSPPLYIDKDFTEAIKSLHKDSELKVLQQIKELEKITSKQFKTDKLSKLITDKTIGKIEIF